MSLDRPRLTRRPVDQSGDQPASSPDGPPSAERLTGSTRRQDSIPPASRHPFGSSRTRHIVAGEFHVDSTPDLVISTTLGSCIAVCLFDERRSIGGMNHFMLPEAPEGVISPSARYGSVSMEHLINRILSGGSARRDLRAKVFGGANLGGWSSAIGDRNVRFVMTYLADEGIPTIAWDVGGVIARAVRFQPSTGRSLLRSIASDTAGILRREQEFQARIRSRPVEGDIELF